jgi:hypothetical protein
MPQQFSSSMTQLLPSACTPDITAPTFAGAESLVPQANGSLLVGWSAATDSESGMGTYEIYVQESSFDEADLFLSSNLASIAAHDELSKKVYHLKDGSLLLDEIEYRVGVRARDKNGNIDQNVVALLATSLGVLEDNFQEAAHDIFIASKYLQAVAGVLAGGAEGKVSEGRVVGKVQINNVIGKIGE